MTKEGIWIRNERGEQEFIYYEDLDVEILPQLWHPIGGFCYRANDFTMLPLSAAPFYLQGWLPKPGKAIIYGSAKAGKSYLAVQLARCIGVAERFLGLPTTQGRVLYIQSELGGAILQRRMLDTGQHYDEVYVGTSFSMKLDTKPGQDQLRRALEAVEANVLILDPWYKLIKGDENEAHDVEVITDFLDEQVIEGFNCSVLLMGHPGKDISKGTRGSSVLEDWVDSLIEMKKTSKKGENLKIKLTPKLLRHAELPAESIEAELKDFEFVLVGAEPTVKEKIEGVFQHHTRVYPHVPLVIQDLVGSGVGSRKAIYNALDVLISQKKVNRTKRGQYLWTGGE